MSMVSAAIAWVHIFSAICWLGSAVFFAAVLGPVISRLTPGSRGELLIAAMGRIEKFELTVATMTVAFGLLLALSLSEWTPLIFFGASCGIIAYAIGVAGMTPVTRRLTGLLKALQSDPNNAELAKRLMSLNSRFRALSIIELVFMVLAMSSMVAAGFL